MILRSLRSLRIGGMAVFDWVATIIAAIIISRRIKYNSFAVFTTLIMASIILHYIFGIKTKTNQFLGIN